MLNRLSLNKEDFDTVCAEITNLGLNDYATGHQTEIHLMRVGFELFVVKQYASKPLFDYELFVWSQMSEEQKDLFVPCEFFENVLIMKPAIDFYTVLQSFTSVAMNITELCVWLMALLIATFYVDSLADGNLYFTDVKLQNFGMMFNEDGTIRVVLVDIGSICIHATKFPAASPLPHKSHLTCAQTHCPIYGFKGAKHLTVATELQMQANKEMLNHVVYFAFLVCLYQILSNNAKSAKLFHCDAFGTNTKYKFEHNLQFSIMFDEFKPLLQEIFVQSKKYSSLKDLCNLLKRTIYVFKQQNVKYLFVGMNDAFKRYFDAPSRINEHDPDKSTISIIDKRAREIVKTIADFVPDPATDPYFVPSSIPNYIPSVTSTSMKMALESTDLTQTFEFALIPRFRTNAYGTFVSLLRNPDDVVDHAIVSGETHHIFDTPTHKPQPHEPISVSPESLHKLKHSPATPPPTRLPPIATSPAPTPTPTPAPKPSSKPTPKLPLIAKLSPTRQLFHGGKYITIKPYSKIQFDKKI